MTSSSEFGSSFGTQFGSGFNANTNQLITDCLVSSGIASNNAVYRERALSFCNYVYLHLLQGRHWSFTNRELSMELTQPYTLGTVLLTQDSSTVVEDVAATASPVISWNNKSQGQLFCPAGGGNYAYRIIKVDTTKKLTLASDYTQTTVANSAYKIIYDRYMLEAGVQDIKSISLGGYGEIRLEPLQKFRLRKEGNPTLTGSPMYATIVAIEEDSGQMQLEVYPAPDKRYTITLEYSLRPVRLEDDETSFPLIPPDHMPALYYGVLAEIYRFQNNAAMLRGVAAKAAMAYNKMASDYEITDPVARVQHGRRYFRKPNRKYRGYYGLTWFPKVDD